MRFTTPDEGPDAGPLPLLSQFEKSDVVRLAEAAMLGIAVILCLLMVFRPMVLRIALAQPKLAGALAGTGADAMLEDGSTGAAMASLPGSPIAAPDTMMRLANVEGDLSAASLKRVAELATAHPEETLAMVRNWISSDIDQ